MNRITTKQSPSLVAQQWIFVVVFVLLGVTAARAEKFFFTFSDPTGDQTGTIDVTKMDCVIDTTSGAYTIYLVASPLHPFAGQFRINVNLFNPDVLPGYAVLQDTLNDYNLTTPATLLILTGTAPQLTFWNNGQRVATNTLAGLGNPPGTTLFRTTVNNFPLGFLANEDAIAYGPTGVSHIGPYWPQIAAEQLRDVVQSCVFAGTLQQSQAQSASLLITGIVAALNNNETLRTCTYVNSLNTQARSWSQGGGLPLEQYLMMRTLLQRISEGVNCGILF